MRPSGSTSTWSATGDAGRPGIVIIVPQRATIRPCTGGTRAPERASPNLLMVGVAESTPYETAPLTDWPKDVARSST